MAKRKRMGARKIQILKAAEHVFAKKDFQQATISDIAKQAGVSDATIYDYFPTKEALLFSIPFESNRRAIEDLSARLEYIRGYSNKLRALIYGYLNFYQHNPDHASVTILILKRNRDFLKTEAYQAFRKSSRLILDVVKEGIASGEFKQGTDPFLVRAMVLGIIEHSVTSWLLLGRPENLVDLVDPVTDLITQGINKKEDFNGLNFKVTLEAVKED